MSIGVNVFYDLEIVRAVVVGAGFSNPFFVDPTLDLLKSLKSIMAEAGEEDFMRPMPPVRNLKRLLP